MTSQPVLVIEHDPTVQLILIDMLSHAGYDVRAAISTEDVRSILSRCRPALAVISGGSRGTFASGWRMAQCIAAIDPTLPLIMLTTNQAVLHEVGRTERGCRFVAGLLKPFDLHELLATVARHLRSADGPAYTSLLRHVDSQGNHGLHEHKEHCV
jgi:DNA-binding response OmpR family regulator